jgi:FkbM family methyltransferase
MKIDWRKHRSYIYGTWEPEVVNAISGAVSAGSIVMDIGSHIGFYALLFSKLVGGDGFVIAFEPLPENFRILEENVHLNPGAKIRTVNKAVTNRSCNKMNLVVPRDNFSMTTSLHGSFFLDEGDPVIVETVSIDDFMHDLRLPIHFIKMDAEGAEALILQGALKTIEVYHPTMLIELHHPDSRGEEHPIIPLLNGLNYEIEWLSHLHPTSHVLVRWNGARI